jgi:hypothetical protein
LFVRGDDDDIKAERDGAELASPGLFVDLGPWQYYLLALHDTQARGIDP